MIKEVKVKKVSVWSPYMGHVGTIRAVLNLCKGLKELGNNVELFKVYQEWEGMEAFLKEQKISVVDFGASRVFPWLPKYGVGYRISMGLLSIYSFPFLWFHLLKKKPDVLLVCLLGFLPMLALRFSPHKPSVILSVQGIPSFNLFRRFLWKHLQSRADSIVVLTDNTRDLLISHGMPEAKIYRINNPIIDDEILKKSLEPLDYPWLSFKEIPVIIAIGRLTRQKDFPTLVRAFARLRKKIPCRLIILGEGEDRASIQEELKRLDIETEVHLLGFVKNPYHYLVKSDVFVLSSLWEDPGHVLMEAAFLRIPIVATDCPSGPRDFLEGEKFGKLCSVGNSEEMAEAILEVLSAKEAGTKLDGAYKKSMSYTIPSCIGQYSKLMNNTGYDFPHRSRFPI